MRGRPSFDSIIDDIGARFGFKPKEVVLSGGSAGGLAVFYNLDHLADKLGPTVKVSGFPDAGFFLDAKTTAGQSWCAAQFCVFLSFLFGGGEGGN